MHPYRCTFGDYLGLHTRSPYRCNCQGIHIGYFNKFMNCNFSLISVSSKRARILYFVLRSRLNHHLQEIVTDIKKY